MRNQTSLAHAGLTRSQMNSARHPPFSTRIPAKLPIDPAKDPNLITEATNNTTSPTQNYPANQDAAYLNQFNEDISQNAVGFHLAEKYSNNQKIIQQDNSNTKFINREEKRPNKIKLAFDEAPTNKISGNFYAAIRKQLKKEAAPLNTEKKQSQKKNVNYVQVKEDEKLTVKLTIPYNPAAEKIIQGKSLRQRFSNLLLDQQKYAIGDEHRRLLRILKNIDTTIEFATMSKNQRCYFLYDLKTNLRDNLRMEISRKQLGQLLFIDSSLFKVEWAMNYSIKKYDILITLPMIRSQDQRQNKIRKGIVDYLFAKQVEFLAERKQRKTSIDCWSAGFDPNQYQIPQKEMPIHPEVQDVQIRAMDREKIDKIENNHLKQFFIKKKDDSEAKSMCSKDVQKMIFSKKSNCEIEEKLLAAIKQREDKLVKLDPSITQVDQAMLRMICQETMIMYMGRNVSNIPKATLIDCLNRKFSTFKIQSIILCLNTMLQADLGFLKEITTMSKTVIYQINKEKFKDMLNYIQGKTFD